ncbi:MAG: V-type ATP synthase subunit D [Planctomycetes bacterium]|nr:V-type ATP synthase subunit D [Planctomycetota bacterium]
MARKKIKLTRPELKRQRDQLTRFQRYLPMLKLKQQQLQMTVREVEQKRRRLDEMVKNSWKRFNTYRAVLADTSGVNIRGLSKCDEVITTRVNVAGVNVPVFEKVTFPSVHYSLFGTPAWVDLVLSELRNVRALEAELGVIVEQHRLLNHELRKIVQRVNLFEKVKIPEIREAIRIIRIKLGDEMTSAVGRAKIAKSKLDASAATNSWPSTADSLSEEAAP